MKIRKPIAVAAALAVASFGLYGCADDSSGGSSKASSSDTLVVDNSFDLKTIDPGRQYEPTGAIVDKALYQTLVTLDSKDLSKPVPELATFKMAPDEKSITLTMKDGNVFSDGSPVTVDDAVFSLKRVQGLKGNPSFMLDGIKIEKVDDKTLKLSSDKAMPEIPFKLANTSLSIVNSKVVKENGGSDTESDKAEKYLLKHSAGSGPYTLEKYNSASEVSMVANPKYKGEKPKYKRVVLRNVQGSTQQINVQGGQTQIALDLSPQQAAQIDKNVASVHTETSETVVFLLLNQNPEINKWTSNPDFLKAVRKGIDYSKLVKLSGKGATQAYGFIPTIIAGGLKSDKTDVYNAKEAKEDLKKSGYDGSEIQMSYANDLTVKGMELQTFAAAIQEQLKDIGINIKLKPAPVATELDSYRDGKEQIGLWYWNPDYFHAATYLVFSPGELVGLRAGWKAGADEAVTKARNEAADAKGKAAVKAYENFQKVQNESGPFIPLVQPPKSVAHAKDIKELGLNPVWTIDVSKVK